MASESHITTLLQGLTPGDRQAAEDLSRQVYADLHTIAERLFKGERQGHTLQPTVLVNESLMRLLGASNINWKDRAHFYAFAARNMRQILIDHSRGKKPYPSGQRLLIDDMVDLLGTHASIDVETMEDALQALEKLSAVAERQAQGVVLRVYGGLTDEEVAHILGVSETTAKNDWRAARAWLRVQLES